MAYENVTDLLRHKLETVYTDQAISVIFVEPIVSKNPLEGTFEVSIGIKPIVLSFSKDESDNLDFITHQKETMDLLLVKADEANKLP